jgi:hypothetical protein
VEDVLTKLHFGTSAGHLGINNTLIRFGNGTIDFRKETKSRRGADSLTSVQQVGTSGQGIWAESTNTMLGHPFERIAIEVAGSFPLSGQGNKYILIAMDYFIKYPEASTVAEALVTNMFRQFGITRELHSDEDRNFEFRPYRK